MPWCPNCKYEYETGIEKCSDCGVELVPDQPANDADLQDNVSHDADEIIHLTSVNSTLQADLIESQLRAFGIPVTKNYSNPFASNTLMMGYNNLGVDIFVPLEMYDKALEILQSPADITEEDIIAPPDEYNKVVEKSLWVQSSSKNPNSTVSFATILSIIIGIALLLIIILYTHK